MNTCFIGWRCKLHAMFQLRESTHSMYDSTTMRASACFLTFNEPFLASCVRRLSCATWFSVLQASRSARLCCNKSVLSGNYFTTLGASRSISPCITAFLTSKAPLFRASVITAMCNALPLRCMPTIDRAVLNHQMRAGDSDHTLSCISEDILSLVFARYGMSISQQKPVL